MCPCVQSHELKNVQCRSPLAIKEELYNTTLQNLKAIQLIAKSITLAMKIMYIIAIPLEINCQNFN